MSRWKLFLDDDAEGSRHPSISVDNSAWRTNMGLPAAVPDTSHLGEWVIAKSYEEAVTRITELGFPSFVSFDHDLGDGLDGIAVARYLVEMDLDKFGMPDDFDFEVHSANPVGRANIRGLLTNYIDVKSISNNRFDY